MFMSMGKEGSDVRALQEMLQQLGFFDGNVTGKYEETTKAGFKKRTASIRMASRTSEP